MKRALIVLGIAVLGLVGVLAVSGAMSGGEVAVSGGSDDGLVLENETEGEVAGATTKADYRKISAEEARGMMDGAEDFVLLDVRTEAEFNEGHIEGAILIPDFKITERVEDEVADKDALIFVYCRSGGRSAGAAKAMVEMGYTRVYDMGGILGWPYEVVAGE